MKNFICKKCGNTTYIIREKLNGTGKTLRLYCAKCGTRHKWLNRQEKVSYSTHSAEIDKDKEIARLTAENQRLKEEAAEQKSIAAHEHATQKEWFRIACDYKAENAELRARLEIVEAHLKELKERTMTDRDKIIEIVLNSDLTGIKIRNIIGGMSVANTIADALIADGLCDIGVWKHRAEVAERALVITAERVLEYAEKANMTAMTSDGFFSCDKDAQLALLANDALLKAEKELAEEEGRNV